MGTSVFTRFSTANIEGSLSDVAARADYDAIAADSDIFGTQEMQRRDARLFVDARVWGTAQSQPAGAQARCAIHWRRDRFQERAVGNVLLHISRLLPSGTRYMEWVRLKDLVTRRYWTVINIHMVPDADDGRGGITTLPRRKLVLVAIKVLLALVRATTFGQLVVLGDFNTDLRKDLATVDPNAVVEQLHTVGLVSSAEILGVPAATHGRDLYDQIYFRRPNKRVYQLIKQVVQPRRNSDHHAFTVTALVTRRKR